METSPLPSRTESGSIPRARPVIELNLNVEEAMIETVDLLRTIRVQLEMITSTVNERLNRTFADAGDDVAKIVHNVETMSSNLAISTGQLYQPVLFSLLFILVVLILLTTLLCICCRIREFVRGQNWQNKPMTISKEELGESKSTSVEVEEVKMEKQQSVAKRRRAPLKWFKRKRETENGRHGSTTLRTPELQEIYEKEPKGGGGGGGSSSGTGGEYHQVTTLPYQQQKEKQPLV